MWIVAQALVLLKQPAPIVSALQLALVLKALVSLLLLLLIPFDPLPWEHNLQMLQYHFLLQLLCKPTGEGEKVSFMIQHLIQQPFRLEYLSFQLER